jgi:hypothetical protein
VIPAAPIDRHGALFAWPEQWEQVGTFLRMAATTGVGVVPEVSQ